MNQQYITEFIAVSMLASFNWSYFLLRSLRWEKALQILGVKLPLAHFLADSQ